MYNQFYNFSEDPFNDAPDPRFLFLSESHKKALDAMIAGIDGRKGFISISGEAGTGKTILIQQLLNRLEKKTKTVFIYHPHITFEDLLRETLLELNLPLENQNKASLMKQFNASLTQRLTHDGNLVIFIDEAQSLGEEVLVELQAFSNLGTSISNLLQIVFVGQPGLEIRLNTKGLRQLEQKIKIRCQIRTLTDEECKKYIDHRLRLVGSSLSKVFTPEAMPLICQYAEGIPRIINNICHNAFWIGYLLSQERLDFTVIEMAVDNIYIQVRKAAFLPSFRDKFWPKEISYHFLSQGRNFLKKLVGGYGEGKLTRWGKV
jgi:general secretion pathway protein A